MTPEEKINYALSLVSPGVTYHSDHPDFQDIVVAARVFPAALRLALAAREARDDYPFLDAALDAFLALLPEPPKEG